MKNKELLELKDDKEVILESCKTYGQALYYSSEN